MYSGVTENTPEDFSSEEQEVGSGVSVNFLSDSAVNPVVIIAEVHERTRFPW